MNISSFIYLPSEIPEEIVSKLEKDYDYMSAILEVASYVGESTDWYDYISEIDDYPPMKELPRELEVDNEVAERYKRGIRNDTERVLYDIFTTRIIIGEQLEYIYKLRDNEESCSAYFIAAYLDSSFYGSTFAFWSEDMLFIQSTTRCLDHTLLSIFELDSNLPRLNTVLEAPIESLARSLGVKTIYTSDKTFKHYGYKKTKDVRHPCKMVTESSELYVKRL